MKTSDSTQQVASQRARVGFAIWVGHNAAGEIWTRAKCPDGLTRQSGPHRTKLDALREGFALVRLGDASRYLELTGDTLPALARRVPMGWRFWSDGTASRGWTCQCCRRIVPEDMGAADDCPDVCDDCWRASRNVVEGEANPCHA